MKPEAIAAAESGARARPNSKVNDLFVLTKVRLNALVVATTAGGYYMAAPASVQPLPLLVACLGTALVASGAAAINQVNERDLDKLMRRTQRRPVAEGRMSAGEGLGIAVALSAVGLAILVFAANLLAAGIALATLLTYVVIYTPMKRYSSLATVVGAVPGALPPLIGWAAARGSIAGLAPWSLFLIMFIWQLPHFLAIAWMYRDDYARAGLPMLPVVDKRGAVTGRQAALWAAMLIPFSMLPGALRMTTPAYPVGAIVLGLGLLLLAVRFALDRSHVNARALFLGSITYLPLLWALMCLARI
jgi:protoheme IX farnesyltransferase